MKRNIDIDATVAEKWQHSRRLLKGEGPADVEDGGCEYLFELEEAVLKGPIRSLGDALAKLSAVELAFVDGERTDGADAKALRQTIRWLKANLPATVASSAVIDEARSFRRRANSVSP